MSNSDDEYNTTPKITRCDHVAFGLNISVTNNSNLSFENIYEKFKFNKEELIFFDRFFRRENICLSLEYTKYYIDNPYNEELTQIYRRLVDSFTTNEEIYEIQKDYLWLKRKDFVMFLAGLGYLPNGDNKSSSTILGKRKQEPADALFDVEDMVRYIAKFL